MTRALEPLLVQIDQGIQDHVEWNQRLLRCAVLRQPPGDDILLPDADRRCRVGSWLARAHDELAAFDDDLLTRIERVHLTMHDAVRAMCGRVLNGAAGAPDDVARYERAQAEMVALLGQLRGRVASAHARIDPLTALPLRHGISHDFAARLEDARRYGALLHVAMIDVDHFKRINDTLGHLVGDAALRHVARVLRAALRKSDVIYRFGGEEFVVLMLSSDVEGAAGAALRLVEAVRASPVPAQPRPVPLTVTVGLTAVRDGDSLDQAVDRADRALLDGKRAGRDRVVSVVP